MALLTARRREMPQVQVNSTLNGCDSLAAAP
jgi:hypothetical protein